MSAATIFADVGEILWEDGNLAEGLELLAVRLDLLGAGPLLQQLVCVDWTPEPPAQGHEVALGKPPAPAQ